MFYVPAASAVIDSPIAMAASSLDDDSAEPASSFANRSAATFCPSGRSVRRQQCGDYNRLLDRHLPDVTLAVRRYLSFVGSALSGSTTPISLPTKHVCCFNESSTGAGA